MASGGALTVGLTPNRVLGRYEFADPNVVTLHGLRMVPTLWAGWFGELAALLWAGIIVSADPTVVGLAGELTVTSAAGVAGYLLLRVFAPDWPAACEVGSHAIHVEYRRKPPLVLLWSDPASHTLFIDTPARRGRRVVVERPIRIAVPQRVVVAVPQTALERLKLEMAAHGLRFTLETRRLAGRARWSLPFGSTVVGIGRA
jgi:hypothetical protein